MPLTICVYGSSSIKTPQKYLDVAKNLGRLLSEGGHLCINGAGKNGCMGALNDEIQDKGGRVRGVIHAKFIVDRVEHPYVVDLIIVEGDDLQKRKKMLVHGVDAIIALPGGLGTWDELWEMACGRGIGMSRIPIVAINVDGFYDGFVQQIERACKDEMLYARPDNLIHFAYSAESALEWCVREAENPSFVPVKIERKAALRQRFIFTKTDSLLRGMFFILLGVLVGKKLGRS